MAAPHLSPTGHRFGRARRLASDPRASARAGSQPFEPLPPPTGTYPFHLALEEVIGASAVAQITESLDFHVMGETGGINNPTPQLDVATALERDLTVSGTGAFDPSCP